MREIEETVKVPARLAKNRAFPHQRLGINSRGLGRRLSQYSERGICLRLSRFIAAAGVTSRRKAETLIKQGRVKVNGQVVTELGLVVDGNRDTVELDGRRLKVEKPVYILLYKPPGYLSTVTDTHGRPTVLDLLPGENRRVYPVGRLDYDTEGLLLLSNDGNFAYLMTHPRHEIEKVYEALVEGRVGRADVNRLKAGVVIDGRKTAPASVRILQRYENRTLLEIRIHEGRKRQVRKMCAVVGHPVVKLKRSALGGLTLGGLKPGDYRYLSEQEVESLLAAVMEHGGRRK